MRLVQPQPKKNSSGLALGFGIPRSWDLDIKRAIPNWGIVLSDAAPSATLATLQDMRRIAQAHADTPMLLIGSGRGVQTVFRCVLSNLTRTVTGLMFFDGNFEHLLDPYCLTLWRALWTEGGEEKGARIGLSLRDAPAPLLEALGVTAEQRKEILGDAKEAPEVRLARALAAAFGPEAPPLPPPVAPIERNPGSADQEHKPKK